MNEPYRQVGSGLKSRRLLSHNKNNNTMTGFDNLKHVTGEQTASEKFGLDDGDIQTLFYMREGGYKKRLLRTYSKSIQSFLKSPESKEAMSSQIDFNIWKSYYFN